MDGWLHRMMGLSFLVVSKDIDGLHGWCNFLHIFSFFWIYYLCVCVSFFVYLIFAFWFCFVFGFVLYLFLLGGGICWFVKHITFRDSAESMVSFLYTLTHMYLKNVRRIWGIWIYIFSFKK